MGFLKRLFDSEKCVKCRKHVAFASHRYVCCRRCDESWDGAKKFLNKAKEAHDAYFDLNTADPELMVEQLDWYERTFSNVINIALDYGPKNEIKKGNTT